MRDCSLLMRLRSFGCGEMDEVGKGRSLAGDVAVK